MKQSRGVVSEKEKTSLLVKKIAKKCKSLDELADRLKAHELKPYYQRHKLKGLWLGKRKLRLTTLGVDKSHLKTLTKEQERLDELKTAQKKQKRDRNIE